MSFRRLSHNAVASILSVLVSAGLLFELYRFLVRSLGPDQIGIWSLVMASASVARLSEFGLGGGVVKFVAEDMGSGKPARAAATVAMSTVAIAVAVGLFCLLITPVLAWLLSRILNLQEPLAAALELLPYAVLSLWLTAISYVFLSTLDGLQRTGIRALVTACQGTAQLLLAYYLVPRMGLLALGWVQVASVALQLLLAASFAIHVVGLPFRDWLGWERKRFLALLRYGGGFQLAALGQMLFEPSVKWLLGIYGGLTITGYFEMANRAVTQFRAVVSSAFQMLVPYVAHRIGQDGLNQADANRAYRSTFRLLLTISIPYFTLVGSVLPILLTVWLGRFSIEFIWVGTICLVGWSLNTLANPAFLLYLALGRLKWTILTQLTIGLLNLLLAFVGGELFGGLGVVAGAMLALTLGSGMVIVPFHREFRIEWRTLRPACLPLLVLTAAIGLWASYEVALAWAGSGPIPLLSVAIGLLLVAIMAIIVWLDPIRVELLGRLTRPDAGNAT